VEAVVVHAKDPVLGVGREADRQPEVMIEGACHALKVDLAEVV
jgi:hypothetical protein